MQFIDVSPNDTGNSVLAGLRLVFQDMTIGLRTVQALWGVHPIEWLMNTAVTEHGSVAMGLESE